MFKKVSIFYCLDGTWSKHKCFRLPSLNYGDKAGMITQRIYNPSSPLSTVTDLIGASSPSLERAKSNVNNMRHAILTSKALHNYPHTFNNTYMRPNGLPR